MGTREDILKTSIADSFTKTLWSSTGTIISDAIIVYVSSSGYLSSLQDVDSSNRQNGYLIHWNAFTGKHEYFQPSAVIVGAPALVNPSTINNFVSFSDTEGQQKDSGYKGSDFAPAANGVTNGNSHDHIGGDGAAITEGALSLSNVTTGDVTIARHGFVPIAPNDTSMFLRGDGTWSAPQGDITGPASSVNNDIVTFSGSTGKIIQDSGYSVNNIVQGPSSATNNNIVSFDGVTGKLIKDSGYSTNNLVQGPNSSVNGNIVIWDSSTGVLIQDSGINFSQLSVAVPEIQMFYNTISKDYTIPSGQNGLSVGPVSVNAGVTVTVTAGSVWTVV